MRWSAESYQVQRQSGHDGSCPFSELADLQLPNVSSRVSCETRLEEIQIAIETNLLAARGDVRSADTFRFAIRAVVGTKRFVAGKNLGDIDAVVLSSKGGEVAEDLLIVTVNPHRVETGQKAGSVAAVEAGPGDDRLVDGPGQNQGVRTLEFQLRLEWDVGVAAVEGKRQREQPAGLVLNVIATEWLIADIDRGLGVDSLFNFVPQRGVVRVVRHSASPAIAMDQQLHQVVARRIVEAAAIRQLVICQKLGSHREEWRKSCRNVKVAERDDRTSKLFLSGITDGHWRDLGGGLRGEGVGLREWK